MSEPRRIELDVCEDCMPGIQCGNGINTFELIFHESGQKDTAIIMNESQLQSIKSDIDRLLADPVYPCRQKAKR